MLNQPLSVVLTNYFRCRNTLLLAAFSLMSLQMLDGQTVLVDITPSHAVNHFVPRESLGSGVDRIPVEAIDKDFTKPVLSQVFEAGWQPVTYRQNTELAVEAWHWNPEGTWSDPAGKGYFTGNATPGAAMIRHSYGYPLPHRGVTRDDGTDNVGYSRLTDGDPQSYWKSNPYLTQAFTGESDTLHPQWVFLDLTTHADVTAMRIAWGQPYAKKYAVQYWTGENPIRKPTAGVWQTFPAGAVAHAQGGETTLQLSLLPVNVRWVRIVMSESSNTCDSHGAA